MVDLSAIPQFDSGILDSPVDRSDVNDKKISKIGNTQDIYKTGNAKIDSYLNSKFNKSVTNMIRRRRILSDCIPNFSRFQYIIQ